MIARDVLPPQVLHVPVPGRYITLTLLMAYLLYLLPWGDPVYRPELPLLVVLYWCLHEPRKVGHAAAFGVGLLVDVADASLFGQHALAYTVGAHLALILRVRIVSFNLWQQALHVFALLIATQVVHLFLNLFVTSAARPSLVYFLASVVGTALWPFLAIAIELPRRRDPGQDIP